MMQQPLILMNSQSTPTRTHRAAARSRRHVGAGAATWGRQATEKTDACDEALASVDLPELTDADFEAAGEVAILEGCMLAPGPPIFTAHRPR